MTLPASLGHAVQLTQQWLKELRDNCDLDDEGAALSALRAVLHQLRDRLTPEEAVDLAAQLPLIVRGIYFEAWRPARTPEKLHTKEEFIDAVAHKLRPHPIAAEAAVRDVFALLVHHCDPGEIADVVDQLPAEIKELWPETAPLSGADHTPDRICNNDCHDQATKAFLLTSGVASAQNAEDRI